MKLGDLAARLPVQQFHGDPDKIIRTVTRDSRLVDGGSLFVAIRGASVDGHAFVPQLTDVGAVVIARDVSVPAGVSWLRVEDTKLALALAASEVEGRPGARVPVVGVTGTNGKTTVTTLLQQVLEHSGAVVGRIGTTGVEVAGRCLPAKLTTPEAPTLQRWLREMGEAGASVVAMEVSSIGLDQRRVDGIPFSLAVFTQLGRDHLDFHGTMEDYIRAKSRLFTELLRPAGGAPRALLCADDPSWPKMGAPDDRWLYGESRHADVRIEDLQLGPGGMCFSLGHPHGRHSVQTSMVGTHNALNATAAFAAGLLLGRDPDALVAGLAAAAGAPGRLEPIDNSHGLTVVVDYAHTPDALHAVIASMKGTGTGRLWVVFGCGGDRDRVKRPEMGRVALSADRICVTSDNPRSEDPMMIIEDICAGIGRDVWVEPDRERAIMRVIAEASAGDVVIIAGKGHETTQEIAGQFLPFDDRAVARRALEAR